MKATLLVALIAFSGCLVTANDPSGEIVWANRPTDGFLLPGDELRWQVDPSLRRLGNDTVILESPHGAATLCQKTRGICWLPDALEASLEYKWWVRVVTDQGIVRSADFRFRTPASGLHLDVDPFDAEAVSPWGNLAWTVTGTISSQTYAIFASTDGVSGELCTGTPCLTNQPLLTTRTYDVEVQAHEPTGLFTTVRFHDVGVNQGPSAARAVFPAPGTEVAAGLVRVEWSPAVDKEEDVVRYQVEHRDLESPTWKQVDAHDALHLDLEVGSGTKTIWRVVATDAAGNTVDGPIAHFATPGAPAASIPLEPIRGQLQPALGVLSFHWAAGGTQVGQVQVSTDNQSWERACSGVSTCDSTLRLRSATTYYWRIADDAGYYGKGTSAVEIFRTTDPVALIHGLWGSANTWGSAAGFYANHGIEVLDFDSARVGVQPIEYRPDQAGDDVEAVALQQVLPAVRQALASAGYGRDSPVALIGHSLGGLVARVIAEKSDLHVSDVITVGTPHLGSSFACAPDLVGEDVSSALGEAFGWVPPNGIREWRGILDDLCPESRFLRSLNSEASHAYRSVAGGFEGFDTDGVVALASATYGAARSAIVPLEHEALPGPTDGALAASVPWLLK